MAVTLTGRLINVLKGTKTDRRSGEVAPKYTAEVLHAVNGSHTVEKVTVDQTVSQEWAKVVGQDIAIEVRSFAMKSEDGSIISGYSCAQKGSLPVLQKPVRQPQPA